MARLRALIIGLACAVAFGRPARAVTVEELGVGPAEVVEVRSSVLGDLHAYAGVLRLDVGGVLMDGFCIDPFHFSSGLMTGYQAVGLTHAPKGRFMSAATELEIERLWGRHYSPNISSTEAAGLQLAIWQLTGGSEFSLLSNNDFGAAAFLAEVRSPDYSGPQADLLGLTGPSQDYAIQRASLDPPTHNVPETASTLGLLALPVLSSSVARCAAPTRAGSAAPPPASASEITSISYRRRGSITLQFRTLSVNHSPNKEAGEAGLTKRSRPRMSGSQERT